MLKTCCIKLVYCALFGGLVFHLVASAVVAAQEVNDELPSANGWRGLQLNVSTADEIIQLLGKPKVDKNIVFKSNVLRDWTAIKEGQSMRRIVYKKIGRYDTVEFGVAENRLVAIGFEVKQNAMKGLFDKKSTVHQAGKMPDVFQTNFLLVEKIPKGAKIADYEGQKETTIPKVYPTFYSLLGITGDSIVWISVENSALKAQWKTLVGNPSVELFPGFVQGILIMSRAVN